MKRRSISSYQREIEHLNDRLGNLRKELDRLWTDKKEADEGVNALCEMLREILNCKGQPPDSLVIKAHSMIAKHPTRAMLLDAGWTPSRKEREE